MKIGTLTYSTEVGPGARAVLASRTLSGLDRLSNVGVDGNPVRPTITGTSAEKCQGIGLCTGTVDGYWTELPCKVDIDVQEFG